MGEGAEGKRGYYLFYLQSPGKGKHEGDPLPLEKKRKGEKSKRTETEEISHFLNWKKTQWKESSIFSLKKREGKGEGAGGAARSLRKNRQLLHHL